MRKTVLSLFLTLIMGGLPLVAQDLSPVESAAPNSVASSLSQETSIEAYLKYKFLGQRVPVYKNGKDPVRGMVSKIQFRDGRYYATIWNNRRSTLDSRINFVVTPGLPERIVELGAGSRNRKLRQNIQVASFVNQAAVGNESSAFSSTQEAIQGTPDLPSNKAVKRTLENDIIYFSVKEDREKSGFFWIARNDLFVDGGYRIRVRFEEVNE